MKLDGEVVAIVDNEEKETPEPLVAENVPAEGEEP